MKTSSLGVAAGRISPLLLGLPRRTLRWLIAASPLFLLLTVLAVAVPALAGDEVSPASTAEPAPVAPAGGEPEAAPGRPAGPSAAVRPEVAERLLMANKYLEDGRADDALSVVDELARIRKLRPVDRAQIHRFRGYILISKGNTEEAGREFESALAENALDDSARQGMMYSLAQLHTQAGRYDRARDLIERWFAEASDPKPEAWFLKAMILVQQEAFAEALAPARTAIEKSPQVRESWLQLLAAIQFQLQDYASLADTLKRLVAVSPGTKRYWVQLATIENSAGKDSEALATLGIAHVAGLLNEDRELRQRARMCFVRDLPEVCARTMEEGLAAGRIEADADAYQLLANCYIAAREIDKAAEPLRKAGELASTSRAFLMLGQLELQKEHFAEAREALGKAKAKSEPGERGSIELLIGIAELGSERYDAAEQAFRAAQADEKTRSAAESYLKHLEQKRALRQLASAS
jgi:tetratricopeptide (TPR) repeat protein